MFLKWFLILRPISHTSNFFVEIEKQNIVYIKYEGTILHDIRCLPYGRKRSLSAQDFNDLW